MFLGSLYRKAQLILQFQMPQAGTTLEPLPVTASYIVDRVINAYQTLETCIVRYKIRHLIIIYRTLHFICHRRGWPREP
jgi:hypothetical protein